MYTQDYKITYDTLFNKYQTVMLSRQNTAQILGLSLSSLDRLVMQENISCRKLGKGNAKNKTVKFPLHKLVEYIIQNNNAHF